VFSEAIRETVGFDRNRSGRLILPMNTAGGCRGRSPQGQESQNGQQTEQGDHLSFHGIFSFQLNTTLI
jgi:hypothetical protein